MDTMYLLIFLMLCMGFAGWMLFLWAVKSGQYDDVEGPKYRMLDEDEEIFEAEKKTGKTAKGADSPGSEERENT